MRDHVLPLFIFLSGFHTLIERADGFEHDFGVLKDVVVHDLRDLLGVGFRRQRVAVAACKVQVAAKKAGYNRRRFLMIEGPFACAHLCNRKRPEKSLTRKQVF
jgi:hypothetical protein